MNLRTPTLALLALATALPAAEPVTTDQRIDDLEQQVKILARKAEIATEEAAAKAKTTAATGTTVTASEKDGFTIKANDGSWRLKFGALFAADTRIFVHDRQGDAVQPSGSSGSSQFLVRWFRPSISGSLGKYIDFTLVPEFGGSAAGIVDGYVDVKLNPAASVRVGKFVQPLGLERWQPASALVFGERSLASNLTSNRDNGIQLSGEFAKGLFGYAVGVFNGNPDNGNTNGETAASSTRSSDGKDVVARITSKPFVDSGNDALNGLTVAVSASVGEEDGASGPSYVSTGQLALTSYRAGVTADGRRVRLNPQLSYYSGSFSLLSEYVIARQRYSTTGGATTASNKGWLISAGYVLTGEKAGWRGVVPAAAFDPANGSWGAVEVVARLHQLAIDGKTLSNPTGATNQPSDATAIANPWQTPRKATAVGLGLNWWLTRNVRLANVYERTVYDGGAGGRNTVSDRATEHVVLSRLQVSF
jgi:phosphate-selective porin OprO/OprP